MSAEIIRLAEKPPLKNVVAKTIDALREGKLIVFPTETVYGLGALASSRDAILRLINAKGRKSGHALPVAISGYRQLAEFIPNIDLISERLARRCWPGPLTIVIDASAPESGLHRLPPEVQTAIAPQGTIGFRVPNHPVFLEILRELNEPVVLTSANLTGEPPAVNAEEAKVGLGDRPDLILDDGTAYFQRPSTVVSISDRKISVLREGVYPKEKIKQMTTKIILFVCTGNTCRSPMAEMVCANLIAKSLQCEISDLESNGYVILSAGIATIPGAPANSEAIEVMNAWGISLHNHQTQPVTEDILRFADLIYVMGKSHRDAICRQWPDHADRVFLLSEDGTDIRDPLGGNFNVYNTCARQIEAELEKQLPKILS